MERRTEWEKGEGGGEGAVAACGLPGATPHWATADARRRGPTASGATHTTGKVATSSHAGTALDLGGGGLGATTERGECECEWEEATMETEGGEGTGDARSALASLWGRWGRERRDVGPPPKRGTHSTAGPLPPNTAVLGFELASAGLPFTTKETVMPAGTHSVMEGGAAGAGAVVREASGAAGAGGTGALSASGALASVLGRTPGADTLVGPESTRGAVTSLLPAVAWVMSWCPSHTGTAVRGEGRPRRGASLLGHEALPPCAASTPYADMGSGSTWGLLSSASSACHCDSEG